MNRDQFNQLYNNLGQKQKVLMICDCGTTKVINKEKAEENLNNHNNNYVCRRCSMKKSHAENPRGEETKEKQRLGRKGKKHSEAVKKRMSNWRKAFYQTPTGKKVIKILAKKAVEQHANKNFDKSKRKILYFSAKNNNEIKVCNSSGEFIACEDFFEKDPNIIKYETQVYYEINDRFHSLDFLIYYKDGSKKIIEIKPKKRLNEIKNIIQMEDSAAYAIQTGCMFELWCEQELGIKNWKYACDRADEYRKAHWFVDYASYRKQKNKQKAKKHYDNKISTDKVEIYCEYCKVYHYPLRKTAVKNIERNNGVYICEKYGGYLSGKKPKLKLIKENPHASLEMKECNKCQRILLFECFSPDKSRRDGFSSKCKECRANFYKEKYHQNKNTGTNNEPHSQTNETSQEK